VNKNQTQKLPDQKALKLDNMSSREAPPRPQLMQNADLNLVKTGKGNDSEITGRHFRERNSVPENETNSNYQTSSAGMQPKPIMKYMEGKEAAQKSYPLKYFKGQDLELYYMEKQLKPGVEREIKEGFFEIRKKFGGQEPISGEEVQVYVSHLCLHNYHPIFCKFNLNVVKTILNYSQIIYLKKSQTLY
jgi:hypothetical protein